MKLMKRTNQIFWVLLCMLLPAKQAYSQDVKIDTGSINGARYKILFPANWQNKLVMYAHGYEFMNTPPGLDNPKFAEGFSIYLERGYAVAASAYRLQGYALVEGIEDTEALRQHFVKTYGQPDSTFMVGHSMGGGVSIGITEKFGMSYHGALPLCPLSSRPYLQTRKEFDLFAVFNVLFPGLVPQLSVIMDPSSGSGKSMQEVFASAGKLTAEIMKDSLLAKQLAARFDLKVKDLPFTLLFGENVLRDVAKKSGGNPFDNTNTVYSGFPDDWLVNQKVERLPSSAASFGFLNKYGPTGNVNIPMVLMHTTYDQLIPPRLAVENYDYMVHAQGKEKNLVVKYTNGQGHCQFTPQQTAEAFDALRSWVNTGRRPNPGGIE